VIFKRIDNHRRFKLFYSPTDKFKTTTLRIFLKGGLADRVEEEAVLPFMLKRGSERYPTLKDISRRLEELYGAALSLDVAKIGEMQILVVSMDVVNPRFLKGSPPLLLDAVETLNDVLLRPILEDGVFPEQRFQQEKTNLARYVKSVIDDKGTYTHLRLLKEMFGGEAFGNYEWGEIGKVEALDGGEVFRCYRRLFDEAPIDVYVVGSLSEEEERRLPDVLLPKERKNSEDGPAAAGGHRTSNQEIVVEEQPLEQSKFEMGFRVNLDCSERTFYALLLYNAILGGGSFSKLFKKVREEDSMAYYISSSFEKLKGFMYVAAGIDGRNFETATARVRRCMDEMAAAEITDEEFDCARKSIINSLNSISDNPGQTIEFDLVSRTAGRRTNIREIAEIIQGITKAQVGEAASQILPGKTFFLKGNRAST
jgi:predicted Zn-dependent peptidase